MPYSIEWKDNILVLRYWGEASKDGVKEFTEAAAKEIRKPEHLTNKIRIATIFLDISNVSSLALKQLGDYSKANTPYVEKSAVVLPSALAAFYRIFLAISGRKDIKAFNNEKEAIEWLKSS